MKKSLPVVLTVAFMALIVACGDENTTNVTNVTETSGIDVVAAGDSLPACDEENVGKIVFAEDSAQVYYCADGKWTTLKGEQGEAGKDGTDGEVGSDGKGCIAEAIDNGYKILCGGDSIGVLLNGEQGEKGEQGIQGEKGEQGEKGLDGASCTAVALEDNSGFNVICGGDTIGVLKNGEKGETGENGSGCKIADQGDGVVEVTCGEGENASTATLYEAMCGAAAYDPATQICADDYIYELCGTSSYDPATHMCLDNQIVSVCSESLDGEKITVNGVSYLCWEQEWIEEKENWQYLNPAISYEMFKDARDGQIYKSVKIGNQVWMAENLNYDYNEGTAKSYCYNDEQESCAKYGRLYTWAAAMDSAGVFGDGGKGCGYDVTCSAKEPVRGICPEGWHLPSDAEWETLFTAVGGEDVAGTKLKSKSGWYNNGNGTDEYGFSVLPAGNRFDVGNYYNADYYAFFWSRTEHSSVDAYNWDFFYVDTYVRSQYYSKEIGFSVRCLRDSD